MAGPVYFRSGTVGVYFLLIGSPVAGVDCSQPVSGNTPIANISIPVTGGTITLRVDVAAAPTPTPTPSVSGIPAWVQAYGRSGADATCEEGWAPSWQEWVQPVTGGWVCTRTIPALG